jgi:hypothetical protein
MMQVALETSEQLAVTAVLVSADVRKLERA